MPAGTEIRLVGSGTVRVTLSTLPLPFGGETNTFTAFYGDFQHGRSFTIGSEPRTCEFTMPEVFFRALPDLRSRPHLYAPDVLRLCPTGYLQSGQLRFHRAEGEQIRPPQAHELPPKSCLFYGTSITHGFCATAQHLSYAAQTARRLGAELINLGVGGSAFCEPQMADYIAGRTDWDFAVLCLSVNMVAFPLDQYRHRLNYFVKTVAAAGKPVFCITILPYGKDLPSVTDLPEYQSPAPLAEYRDALRRAVTAASLPLVHLIEGSQLLEDFGGLTTDLIHPGDYGMTRISENLARCIQSRLDETAAK